MWHEVAWTHRVSHTGKTEQQPAAQDKTPPKQSPVPSPEARHRAVYRTAVIYHRMFLIAKVVAWSVVFNISYVHCILVIFSLYQLSYCFARKATLPSSSPAYRQELKEKEDTSLVQQESRTTKASGQRLPAAHFPPATQCAEGRETFKKPGA